MEGQLAYRDNERKQNKNQNKKEKKEKKERNKKKRKKDQKNNQGSLLDVSRVAQLHGESMLYCVHRTCTLDH